MTREDKALLREFQPTDNAPELPVGWIRITVESRGINPSYEVIAMTKAAMVQQLLLTQVSPENRDEAEEGIAIQVDAQFAALEARPDNVPTQLVKAVAYVAPVDRVPGLAAELERPLSVFGLDLKANDDDEGDEEDEELGDREEPEMEVKPAPPKNAERAREDSKAKAKPTNKKIRP